MSGALLHAMRDVADISPSAFNAAITRHLVELPYGSGVRALISALDELATDQSADASVIAAARSAADDELRKSGDPLLSTKQLGRRYGVTPRTAWNVVRNQDGFPRPIRTSAGQTVWRLSDIIAWEDREDAGDHR